LRKVPLPRLLARAFHVVGKGALAAKIDASASAVARYAAVKTVPPHFRENLHKSHLSAKLLDCQVSLKARHRRATRSGREVCALPQRLSRFGGMERSLTQKPWRPGMPSPGN